MQTLIARTRTKLLAGIAVTVPAVATFLVLRFLFRSLDALLGPWIAQLIGREIPGLGVLATVGLLLIVGVVATHYIGARLISTAERLFSRVPLVRRIYSASKEIVESATLSKRGAFRDVVMVEHPRRGSYSYGFVTSYTTRHEGDTPRRLANVFVPGPPVPTTGVLVAVPVEDLFYVDLPVEDALKLILSGGMAAPADLRERPQP
ncbi:DUF502 domain-containing protein [bacterium]|nr:DUF502 domain-containing protein [bacterium]